jgi:hypothetical protein
MINYRQTKLAIKRRNQKISSKSISKFGYFFAVDASLFSKLKI